MLNKIKYLKCVKKENIKILEKYKKILDEIETYEVSLNKKIIQKQNQTEDIKNIYSNSLDMYQKICINLLHN